jgi:prepilin-type N-terminal cleavage/methylation domain-containing protein
VALMDSRLRGNDMRGQHPAGYHRVSGSKGFTLAEVLVASTITGFIALVAVSALKTVTDSAQVVNRTSETAGELRFAARMLQRDLANLYRDPNPENMRLIGVSQDADAGGPAFLTFYTVARAKARAEQPEGDVYEVEYFVSTREQKDETAVTVPSALPGQPEGMILLRRVWPNPDKEREPRGVLTPIAENIGIFQVRFFDGKQWGGEWSEEMKSLPEMIEVTLGIQPAGRTEPVLESFLVNLPRLAKGTGAAASESETSEGGQEPQAEPQRQETGGQSTGGNQGASRDNSGSRNSGGSRNDGGPRNRGGSRDGGGRQGPGGRR